METKHLDVGSTVTQVITWAQARIRNVYSLNPSPNRPRPLINDSVPRLPVELAEERLKHPRSILATNLESVSDMG